MLRPTLVLLFLGLALTVCQAKYDAKLVKALDKYLQKVGACWEKGDEVCMNKANDAVRPTVLKAVAENKLSVIDGCEDNWGNFELERKDDVSEIRLPC